MYMYIVLSLCMYSYIILIDRDERRIEAYGLCQELHSQLKKQTDEFQSFMVGVRASIGLAVSQLEGSMNHKDFFDEP